MRPLKFLYLTTFYPPYSFGGDAVYLHRVAHALGDAGHTVDVVHCVDSYHLLHPAPPPIAWAEHPRVTRHELRSGVGSFGPLVAHQTGRPLLTRGQLRAIFASKDFDVVHYHNISLLGPGVLEMEPASRDFVKLYTTHEHWLVCPMHVLWKFNSRACEKPECLRCTLQGKRPPQYWRYTGYLDRAARRVQAFVSPSRFTARMHAERGFSQPVGHLPYFLDRQDEDWRHPAPRPQQRPYFLFVGRLERIKGLDQLIRVWPRTGDYDLLVAGTGQDEAELRQLAAGQERIRFLGPQPQGALGALYTHAIATIVPSVTYETFGIIIIESFARKTPVIVRDLGALPEVVQDSGGGAIFGTEDQLVQAVRAMADQPAHRDELGAKGYDAFTRYWDRDAHLRLYFDTLARAQAKKAETK
jgi:glycosyltransferase involved in cell wall biosynthesis